MKPITRVAAFVGLVGLTACDSDIEAKAATVSWMEWPAAVPPATPFTVRMLVFPVGCSVGTFRPQASADESAVTFAPYFLVKRGGYCLPEAQIADIYFGALDTAGTAPGLAAQFPRTYEMRAAASVQVPAPLTGAADLPVRTFGQVVVQAAVDPHAGRRNAAGFATKVVDELGCTRLLPNGLIDPRRAYMLEDQADTSGLFYVFVRGYIYQPAAPVCGEAKVFHLLSRN